MTFRHLDLFAGIGGFSRAVHWLGGETVAFVEWEAWNRRVLAKHWPHARFFGDIHDVGADELSGLGRIDLITGGYPCQPFSHAGKRLGEADDRHLWPEMRRVIDLTRPRYILAENVAGHINMGLDLVLSELEADGYTGRAIVVPAAAVNALHRRDRVWIMAYAAGARAGDSTGAAGRQGRQPAGTPEPASLRQGHWPAVRVGAESAGGNDAGAVAHAECLRGREQLRVDAAQGALPAAEWGEGTSRTRSGGEAATGHALADATPRGLRCGRAPRHERQPALSGEGAAVGHTDGAGLEGRQLGRERAGERAAGTAGGESTTANADRGRFVQCPERDLDTEQPGLEAPCRHDALRHGASLPRAGAEAPRSLDAGVDGVSAGLVRRPAARSAWDDPDVIRAMWADGSWEADLPRVVAEEAERRQKLQAAGNAIVSVVAYEILRVMLGADDA